VPDDPVFTVERRTVNVDVPLFFDDWRFFSDLFSTFLAVFFGGGGGAGGGTGGNGSGILGAEVHIIL